MENKYLSEDPRAIRSIERRLAWYKRDKVKQESELHVNIERQERIKRNIALTNRNIERLEGLL